MQAALGPPKGEEELCKNNSTGHTDTKQSRGQGNLKGINRATLTVNKSDGKNKNAAFENYMMPCTAMVVRATILAGATPMTMIINTSAILTILVKELISTMGLSSGSVQ